jgi:hypothetical protein
MRGRSFILRCSAFFLLVIFSQKAGTGLLLHNLLHAKQATEHSTTPSTGKQEIGLACNCIDDFLMPFESTEVPVVSSPVLQHESPVAFVAVNIPFRDPVLSSLRGPPSSIL